MVRLKPICPFSPCSAKSLPTQTIFYSSQVSELLNMVIYRLKLLFYGSLTEKMLHEIITLFYQMSAVLLGAVNNRAVAQRSFVP